MDNNEWTRTQWGGWRHHNDHFLFWFIYLQHNVDHWRAMHRNDRRFRVGWRQQSHVDESYNH
jgi:hypothetical protein